MPSSVSKSALRVRSDDTARVRLLPPPARRQAWRRVKRQAKSIALRSLLYAALVGVMAASALVVYFERNERVARAAVTAGASR